MQARESKRARESALVRCRGLFSAGRQTVRDSPLALVNFRLRCDGIPLRPDLNTQTDASRFRSLVSWTVHLEGG
jgi:hypothetical protein